ncbi:Rac/Rho-like_protein [Hexamita inflata]|uniref:Rac/Rho-like protein n=1 Tax=Hexamita inflata TaxID=28002 RepID=A0AA86UZP5_9EUKA|nr:Rac/Rho-like protein [Hexamita inflata]
MKCLLVGDRTVGKTSLAALYQTRKYNKNYDPMLDDIVKKTVKHNSYPIQFNLWDCSYTNYYDLVRPIMQSDTDVVLVCYSVENKISLNNSVPVADFGENFCFRMTLYQTIIQGWSILVFFVETITTSNANEKSYSLIFVRQLVNYYRPTFLMVNTRTNISELTKYTLVLWFRKDFGAQFHILNCAKVNLVQTKILQYLYHKQLDFSLILNLQRYSRLYIQF